MECLIKLFRKDFTKKILVFLMLILILQLLTPVLNILLLTFIFIYISNTIESFIISKSSKYIKINEKALTLILYIIIFTSFAFLLYKYVPLLITQSVEMLTKLSAIKINIESDNPVLKYVQGVITEIYI